LPAKGLLNTGSSEKRRLFCAIALDGPTRLALARAQNDLRSGRPSAQENLHLTLAFLGSCTNAQEQAARSALDAACLLSRSFDLTISGIGRFDKKKGSIIWAGVSEGQGKDELLSFQKRLVAELLARGFELSGEYTPHITLARGAKLSRTALDEDCSRAARDIGERIVSVREAHLMWSHHPNGGALTYTSIYCAPFGGA
jgi:2'-5' RNA ligase